MEELIKKVKNSKSVESYDKILKSAMKKKIPADSKDKVARAFIEKAIALGDMRSRIESFVFVHQLGLLR